MPGVGHKLRVLLCLRFWFSCFPVDTYSQISPEVGLTNGKNVVQTGKDLKEVFPKNNGTTWSPNNLVWKRIKGSRLLWNNLKNL